MSGKRRQRLYRSGNHRSRSDGRHASDQSLSVVINLLQAGAVSHLSGAAEEVPEPSWRPERHVAQGRKHHQAAKLVHEQGQPAKDTF